MDEQTWMVTGASGGLGLALVEHLLEAGHRVVATTRGTGVPLEHPHLEVLRLDPADRSACHEAVGRVTRAGGGVDVLVNNAGFGLVGAVEEVSEEEARAIVDADLLGPLWMTQAVLPGMRARGRGHVLQVSSVGGVGAMPFLGLYNAAKWGLEAFSEALAGEVAELGIRVTIAEVGAMDTRWATGSMRFSRPLEAYDATRAAVLGTAQVPWPGEPGATGGGDAPAEVAAALVRHVTAGAGHPLRVVVGTDAAEQVAAALERRGRESISLPVRGPVVD